MKMTRLTATIVVFLTLMLTLTACTGKQGATNEKKESMDLKIGLMPAVDSAPILLAEKKGYFKELGLNANVEVYTNAMNRQSALQSGELDGTITDLIAFINNVQNKFDIKITTGTDGVFPFLVKKGFQEKENISVGTMEISVTNFLTDEYLSGKYKMDKVFIDEIPARLEMIKAGKMDMANIPEPMASMGELDGLEKRLFPNKDAFMPEAMVFTGKALKEKEKAIKLFHQAYNKAVDDINKNPNEAREVLIEKLKLNPKIKDMMTLPEYHKTQIPDEAYMKKIIDWVEKVQKIKVTVKYEDMIERKFIQ